MLCYVVEYSRSGRCEGRPLGMLRDQLDSARMPAGGAGDREDGVIISLSFFNSPLTKDRMQRTSFWNSMGNWME